MWLPGHVLLFGVESLTVAYGRLYAEGGRIVWDNGDEVWSHSQILVCDAITGDRLAVLKGFLRMTGGHRTGSSLIVEKGHLYSMIDAVFQKWVRND